MIQLISVYFTESALNSLKKMKNLIHLKIDQGRHESFEEMLLIYYISVW